MQAEGCAVSVHSILVPKGSARLAKQALPCAQIRDAGDETPEYPTMRSEIDFLVMAFRSFQ